VGFGHESMKFVPNGWPDEATLHMLDSTGELGMLTRPRKDGPTNIVV
jgi:hypothetical protein